MVHFFITLFAVFTRLFAFLVYILKQNTFMHSIYLYRVTVCDKKPEGPFLQRVHIARNADRCNSQRISVCLSVRLLSVTFRCFVQKNEHTIVQSSQSGSKIILVSEEIKFVRMRLFAGITLSEGLK